MDQNVKIEKRRKECVDLLSKIENEYALQIISEVIKNLLKNQREFF